MTDSFELLYWKKKADFYEAETDRLHAIVEEFYTKSGRLESMSVSGKSFRPVREEIRLAAEAEGSGLFERIQLVLEEQLGAYWEYKGSVTSATAEAHRHRIVEAIIMATETWEGDLWTKSMPR